MELSDLLLFTCFLAAALARESTLELTREWKPDFGWEVVCAWHLPENDSLQSLRLIGPDHQYLSYRPETDGPESNSLKRLPTMEFRSHCYISQQGGRTGQCTIKLELLQPMKDDVTYTCEVSGERPQFRSEAKTVNIEALVRPSDAKVERIGLSDPTSERVSVNCTSHGLPAPNLVWTIGDQKIPEDFSGGSWNFTSKLYHMWSSISYTPVGSTTHAVCTPEILRGGQLVKGQPAQYSSAGVLKGVAALCSTLVSILILIR